MAKKTNTTKELTPVVKEVKVTEKKGTKTMAKKSESTKKSIAKATAVAPTTTRVVTVTRPQSQRTNDVSFEYEVVDTLVIFAERTAQKGYKTSKELRLIKWNGGETKYDLREWYTDVDGNERPNKGISLSKDEWNMLAEVFNTDKNAEE